MYRERNSYTLLVRMHISSAIMENSMECLHNLKMDLLYIPSTSLLGIWPKSVESAHRRDKCTPIYCSTIHYSCDTESTQVAINRYVNKENAVPIYDRILFNKRREQFPIVYGKNGWD